MPEARIIGNVRAGDIARVVRAALSAQVQDVAESKPLDLNITKKWFEKRAALEVDHEIGAGRGKATASIDPTPEELAELYRIAHRIPEGWQLVPVEPTQEIIETLTLIIRRCAWGRENVIKQWMELLAAAPAGQDGT